MTVYIDKIKRLYYSLIKAYCQRMALPVGEKKILPCVQRRMEEGRDPQTQPAEISRKETKK